MRLRTALRPLLIIPVLLAALLASGCAPRPLHESAPTAAESPTKEAAQATSAPVKAVGTPQPGSVPMKTQGTAVPVTASTGVLYQDNFTDPSTGWPEAKFDNYFIGYHEPEYYHIEVDSPNSRAPVFVPGKKPFGDATIELSVQVNSKKTAADGDFLYGIIFRRAGDNYYAFVVSPRSQEWRLLKSSPSAVSTLAQGADTTLHAADADDLLRVDASGSTFALHINGRLVAQVSDADYAEGEVGFYMQTLDCAQAHVHFDQLIVRGYQQPEPVSVSTTALYHDNFTDPSTGWPEAKFDNYFIGYHEPEYYHIEIDSPNYHAPIFAPGKKSYGDASVQLQVQVNSKKTAADGDFAYGLALRRSGDNYYAFVISPRGQRWMFLKSSSSAVTTLAQGTDTTLHAADADDLLRVDASGATFALHVNGRLVAEVTDPDYPQGEIGFFVQTFDAQQVHVHFDDLVVSEFEAPLLCTVADSGAGLNLRGGPGRSSPVITSLQPGTSLEPLGHSADGEWLNVRMEQTGQAGWVSAASRYVSCNRDPSLLPLVIP